MVERRVCGFCRFRVKYTSMGSRGAWFIHTTGPNKGSFRCPGAGPGDYHDCNTWNVPADG